MPLAVITSSVSIAAGVFSVIATLLSLILGYLSQRDKLQETQKQQFHTILESDDLIYVGNYLDLVIGNFNIYEYATDSKVSETVDTYLEKLRLFVGTDAEVEQQIREIGTPPKIEVSPEHPEGIDSVLKELASGEIWNALARLRRHIEITLRELAKAKGIFLERPSSAGYLLNMLLQREVIPKDAFSNLKYSITICNKAIHGFEVNMDEAKEATFHADVGLRRLKERPT